jgi:hypothetical protein
VFVIGHFFEVLVFELFEVLILFLKCCTVDLKCEWLKTKLGRLSFFSKIFNMIVNMCKLSKYLLLFCVVRCCNG